MKYKKSISILTLLLLVLSLVASTYGIFSSAGSGPHQFTTLSGETIQLYGKGIYKNDSVSGAEQEIAQDIVTLGLGIPLLMIALCLSRRESIRGRFLLAGTLGFFLYTYASYSFLTTYNSFFLLYVILMSASFFAFILTIMSFDMKKMAGNFKPRMPVKFIGSFLIFIGVAILIMWLGRIIPALMNNTVPYGLDHYTTLVIQALDLGLIVPGGILSGVLVLKRKPFGFLLAAIFIVKGFTMLTAITAMSIRMIIAGVQSSFAEIAVFTVFNIVIIFCLYLVMKNIQEPPQYVGWKSIIKQGKERRL
ncbi:hypothetical protein [Bacillus sp. V33-4]|uniref:hypothetical protein n=1 Tax=Bacillus sp. V33-4 TaxID=2054169 RepID=UPI000C76F38E|nr:hypothetical protein [Bacillus sp. V33-4]PLR84849.1 hypothetical protein CVD23_10720 [Bacillus sp. V33-4]